MPQTQNFGNSQDGRAAKLYTISDGKISAKITDYGATLVNLLVPSKNGSLADVVLGYDCAGDYWENRGSCLGATVGRNANRTGKAQITLNGQTIRLSPNERSNNLHSGPDFWFCRMWTVTQLEANAITLHLDTPDGDQGFPGGGSVDVSYTVQDGALEIRYSGCFDQDTVFNPTNHTYFNLAGHAHPELAMDQILTLSAPQFTPVDAESIPTGELASVEGTALDFRQGAPLGRGRENDPLLKPQWGIDHNVVLAPSNPDAPVATLHDPSSGRSMQVYTDRPGIQVYCANYLNVTGKGSVAYGRNSAICLETQYFPDAFAHDGWPKPIALAGQVTTTVTRYAFLAE